MANRRAIAWAIAAILPAAAPATAAVHLETAIVAPAVPAGWVPVTGTAVQEAARRAAQSDTALARGEAVQVALRWWVSPDGRSGLVVALARWPSNINDLDDVDRRQAAAICRADTADPRPAPAPTPGLDGAYAVSCHGHGSTAAVRAAVVVARKGAVTATVASSGPAAMALDRLVAIARTQQARLPAVASASDRSALPTIAAAVGGGIAAGALVAVVAWLRRRNPPIPPLRLPPDASPQPGGGRGQAVG